MGCRHSLLQKSTGRQLSGELRRAACEGRIKIQEGGRERLGWMAGKEPSRSRFALETKRFRPQIPKPDPKARPLQMSITWNSIIEGTVAGVVASLLFAALVVIRDLWRIQRFKEKLRANLRNITCGNGIHGITVSIHNLTGHEFTVHDVVLVCERSHYAFNCTGEVSSYIPRRRRALTPDETKRLERGETVEAEPSHVSFRSSSKSIGDGRLAPARPFTSVGYLLPAEILTNVSDVVRHIRIAVEYVAANGRIDVLEETSVGASAEYLKILLSQYSDPTKRAQFNEARKVFGLPPIGVSPKNP